PLPPSPDGLVRLGAALRPGRKGRDVGVLPERRRPRRPGAPAREPRRSGPGPRTTPGPGLTVRGEQSAPVLTVPRPFLTGTTAAATATQRRERPGRDAPKRRRRGRWPVAPTRTPLSCRPPCFSPGAAGAGGASRCCPMMPSATGDTEVRPDVVPAPTGAPTYKRLAPYPPFPLFGRPEHRGAMTDYRRPLSFGVNAEPSAAAWPLTRLMSRRAEDSGLDYIAVQDHPYQPGHLEAWTLISHLSAHTDRISFLTDVADLQLRPPAMLATAAASLSVLTDGRVQLGVGGGGIPDAIASMGGPARRGRDMVAYAEDALGVLRTALPGGPVQVDSPYHAIGGYQAGPVPPKPVGVWLGAQKAKMLALAGRVADGWISPLNIYVPPE